MIGEPFTAAPPIDVARRLDAAHPGGVVFFDSGAHCDGSPRWSILTCRPTAILTEREGVFVESLTGAHISDPVGWMRDRLSSSRGETTVNLPFVGGLAGFLGFEFAWWLDDVGAPAQGLPTPALWVGDFPAAALYCHLTRAWRLVGALDSPTARSLSGAFEEVDTTSAPPTCSPNNLQGARMTVERDVYLDGVRACIEAIAQGELFEINYTERFVAQWPGTGFELFEALRARSTGAFGGYLGAPDFQLASVSPEQFMAVKARSVVTRPIKGTRPRSPDPARDQALAQELLESAKDRAENVMIVDLMRNDLTRICELGTVQATEICVLESFAGVHHLVSTVTGELADGLEALDAFLACFPAGSITGAPKLRAMELIAELEHSGRGPYTGSMFYASRHGRLDSNVLIRTATLMGTSALYGAGGAIVSDSDPDQECDEAWTKARAFCDVMTREAS